MILLIFTSYRIFSSFIFHFHIISYFFCLLTCISMQLTYHYNHFCTLSIMKICEINLESINNDCLQLINPKLQYIGATNRTSVYIETKRSMYSKIYHQNRRKCSWRRRQGFLWGNCWRAASPRYEYIICMNEKENTGQTVLYIYNFSCRQYFIFAIFDF